MKRYDMDEPREIEGQISINDIIGDRPGDLFAVSKIFADARKQMNLAEYKTLAYALSKIRFKDTCPEVIMLDMYKLAEAIGLKCDKKHISQDMFRAIGRMPNNSNVVFADKDKKSWISGMFITSVACHYGVVSIRFNTEYRSLFGDLDRDFLTMYASDIFKMKSERSVIFYEKLREASDSRVTVNEAGFGIKALKEMFGIPKDGRGSYMRSNGDFDRPSFEKFVIEPICEDINKGSMINLILQPDGKYYEKLKENGRVKGYIFRWNFTSYPRVATASEVKEIQERVDQNPLVLKVAKDIIAGEKKPKKNAYNDFEQRKPDYSEIERKLFNQ